MAIFKRAPRDQAEPTAANADTASNEEAAAPVDTGLAEEATAAPAEDVPHVGISVSTFGKPAATVGPATSSLRPVTRPPAEAPARTETIAGMPDNTLVQAALAALPEKPTNNDVMNVMRQALQGTLYVRVRGDARALTAAGDPLTLAVSQVDDARFLLAFTGGAALTQSVESDGDTDTSALGLPVSNVFRNVIEGPYDGLIIDHATTGRRIVLPAALVKKAVEEGDPKLTLKNLLAAPRDAETAAAVGAALPGIPLWVAAGPAGDSGQLGLAESRTASGERRLEVFSHPLEVLVLGRGDRPVPVETVQLARALAANDALNGLMIDPGGPWIQVDRENLGAVLEAADGDAPAAGDAAAAGDTAATTATS